MGTVSLAKRSDLHILRKLWHISTGSICIYLYYVLGYDKQFWAWFALICAALGFLFDIVRLKSYKINSTFLKYVGPILRTSEKETFSGLPFYALGMSLSLFFYKEPIALLSIFFLVFADPISSFCGVLFGKDKILPNKSVQGSAAGFFTCYLITLFFLSQSNATNADILVFSLVSGIIGSFSELVSAYNVDDNLTIPVLSGLGMTIVNYFFQIF